MEEALRSGAPAAVAGAVGTGLDLKTSQRLHLAAEESGLPLLLLRPAARREAERGGDALAHRRRRGRARPLRPHRALALARAPRTLPQRTTG